MRAVLLAVVLLFSFNAVGQESEKLKLPRPEEVAGVEISETSLIRWHHPEELLELLPRFVAAEGTYGSKQPFQRGKFILKNGRALDWLANSADSILLCEGSKEQLYVLPKEGKTPEKNGPLFRIWDAQGKEGFIDIYGNVVIEPQFERVTEFSEGLAAVSVGGKWGYIDAQGRMAIEPRWKDNDGWRGAAGAFHQGLAAVVEYARWGVRDDSNYWTYKCGYIDRRGDYVVQPKMRQNCLPFHDGLAIVEMDFEDPEYERGKGWVGYMDARGNWAMKPRFLSAGYFHEGVALVRDESGEYFIDKTGARADERANACLWREYFYEGLALKFSEKEKRFDGFIDEKCQYVFRLAPEIKVQYRTHFSAGRALFYKESSGGGGGKLFGYLDRTGEIAIPFQFTEASDFSEGLAGVAVEEKGRRFNAYIDTKGEIILKDTRGTAPFKNGLAFHKLYTWTISERPAGRNIYGYMNKHGKYVWLSPRAEIYLDRDWIKENYVGK